MKCTRHHYLTSLLGTCVSKTRTIWRMFVFMWCHNVQCIVIIFYIHIPLYSYIFSWRGVIGEHPIWNKESSKTECSRTIRRLGVDVAAQRFYWSQFIYRLLGRSRYKQNSRTDWFTENHRRCCELFYKVIYVITRCDFHYRWVHAESTVCGRVEVYISRIRRCLSL